MDRAKGREFHARGNDRPNAGHVLEIDTPALGIVNLRHKAEIRHGRAVAMTESASRWMCEQGFKGAKPLDELKHPGTTHCLAATSEFHDMGTDAHIADGMDIHGDRVGESPNALAAGRSEDREA